MSASLLRPVRVLAPWALGLFLLSAAAWLVARPVDARPNADPLRDVAPARVVVVPAEAAADAAPVPAHGRVRAAERAVLSFALGGRVAWRGVALGDPVEAGERLARLDAGPLAAQGQALDSQLREMEARVAQAERDRDRSDSLAASGVLAAQSLEAAELQTDVLAAQRVTLGGRRLELRRRLAQATLRAPFAGRVTEVHLEAGELAAAGAPVVTLQGEGRREVEVGVPVDVAARLVLDEPARVVSEGRAEPIAARIRTVVPGARRADRLYAVVLDLPAEPVLLPGTPVDVELSVHRTAADAVCVPVESVTDPAGERPSVFVVRDGRAVRVAVSVRSLVDGAVEIEGGLEAGEPVVVRGLPFLLDGDRVEVMR